MKSSDIEKVKQKLAFIVDQDINWYRIVHADWDSGGRELFIEKTASQLSAESSTLRIFDREVNVEGRDVLDVGCGFGNLSRALSGRGANVCSLDIEPEFCSIVACSARDENVRPVCGVSEALPFQNAVFDIVVCTHVIEHVRSVSRTISELLRVLKHGGVLYLSSPNYLYFRELHYKKLWLPLMPRMLFKWYIRLQFRSRLCALNLKASDCPQLTEHIDELNYITIPLLRCVMKRHGIYPRFVYDPEEMKASAWKKPIKLLMRLLMMYPSEIHMFALKQ
jgi:2-polyprenyl-3-methyl-5-hydroxy-6-metoxy-1,4-benzoquinol methylase